jgi:hypothetical protein
MDNDDLNENDFVEMFYGIENDDLTHVCGGPGESVRCVDCAKMTAHWNYNYLGYFMCDACVMVEDKLEMNVVRGLDEYDEDWNWKGYEL